MAQDGGERVGSGTFETPPRLDMRFEQIAPGVPVLTIDGFYRDPDAVRATALGLDFEPPPYPYPGRLARPPEDDPALAICRRKVLDIVNRFYLPNVPPLEREGRPIAAFRTVDSDFAIVDVHPRDLTPVQQRPHVDPVPVFALVYLNREERGGTLFFAPRADAGGGGRGYPAASDAGFELLGRIEGRFNRLAIYPGFVPHSGEIVGGWIEDESRFTAPRLTQRFVFFD